jgi:hypothetical protein
MIGANTKMVIFLSVAALWAIGPVGHSYANSLPEGQVRLAAEKHVTSEVEIYRRDSFPSYKNRMIDLCRRLEADSSPSDANRTSNLEIYRKETGPGITEYHREYRESSRFSDPASEERTLALCRRLEKSSSVEGPANSETHIYRERTTVPK